MFVYARAQVLVHVCVYASPAYYSLVKQPRRFVFISKDLSVRVRLENELKVMSCVIACARMRFRA